MARYAIYQRSKRRRDFVLVLWPVVSDDEQSARESAHLVLHARNQSTKRLHVAAVREHMLEPPARIRAGAVDARHPIASVL